MPEQVICSACPNCGHENGVNPPTSHKDLKHLDIYTITCRACSESYDVTSDDLVLRDKTSAEIAHMGLVTTVSWV